MSIDRDTVAKLEKLSMFQFDEAGKEKVQNELGSILDFVSQLQEVNTDGVEAMASTVGAESTPEREDKVTFENNRENLLEGAPNKEMGFFTVPRVVE